MRTLRYLSCPVCDYSMPGDVLTRRMVGRFRADIRLCRGRKGLPHVAFEDMTPPERELVRQRLLSAVHAALQEGVLSEEDLLTPGPASVVARGQIPMSLPVQTAPLSVQP